MLARKAQVEKELELKRLNEMYKGPSKNSEDIL